MNPKEKAHDLYIKYRHFWSLNEFDAKQCALIAANEVADQFTSIGILSGYWFEVKQEIEKL